MILELVNLETFERTKYETWSCDDRGTRQALVEIDGKMFVVNVISDKPICANPSQMSNDPKAIDQPFILDWRKATNPYRFKTNRYPREASRPL